MKKRNVVPFTEREWKFVKANVRSDDLGVLEELAAILEMFLARTGDDSPVVVALTKNILDAVIFDKKNCSTDEGWYMEPTGASLYAMALIRFVNHLNEIGQPKTGHLLSVFDALRELGVPEWIVKLRHAVVHGNVPSFRELRTGVEFCRQWLTDILWIQPMTLSISEPSARPRLVRPPTPQEAPPDSRDLLANYWQLVTKMSGCRTEKRALQRQCLLLLKEIRLLLRQHKNVAIESFAQVVLLPVAKADRKTKKMRKLLGENFKLRRMQSVPTKIDLIWRKVVDQFVRCEAIGDLLAYVDARKPPEATLGVVAANMINTAEFFDEQDFESVLRLFAETSPKREFFREMWAAKRGLVKEEEVAAEEEDGEDKIMTVEDLKRQLYLYKESAAKESKTTAGDWTLVSFQTPLGLTDRQTAESLELSVSNST
ncbi:hypothetical protein M3Y99_00094900 [Aphelenchoides fujianensis]|nr:hypothetical protein M3Y99_00094900 [Aphelenchoides fujianensis]